MKIKAKELFLYADLDKLYVIQTESDDLGFVGIPVHTRILSDSVTSEEMLKRKLEILFKTQVELEILGVWNNLSSNGLSPHPFIEYETVNINSIKRIDGISKLQELENKKDELLTKLKQINDEINTLILK